MTTSAPAPKTNWMGPSSHGAESTKALELGIANMSLSAFSRQPALSVSSISTSEDFESSLPITHRLTSFIDEKDDSSHSGSYAGSPPDSSPLYREYNQVLNNDSGVNSNRNGGPSTTNGGSYPSPIGKTAKNGSAGTPLRHSHTIDPKHVILREDGAPPPFSFMADGRSPTTPIIESSAVETHFFNPDVNRNKETESIGGSLGSVEEENREVARSGVNAGGNRGGHVGDGNVNGSSFPGNEDVPQSPYTGGSTDGGPGLLYNDNFDTFSNKSFGREPLGASMPSTATNQRTLSSPSDDNKNRPHPGFIAPSNSSHTPLGGGFPETLLNDDKDFKKNTLLYSRSTVPSSSSPQINDASDNGSILEGLRQGTSVLNVEHRYNIHKNATIDYNNKQQQGRDYHSCHSPHVNKPTELYRQQNSHDNNNSTNALTNDFRHVSISQKDDYNLRNNRAVNKQYMSNSYGHSINEIRHQGGRPIAGRQTTLRHSVSDVTSDQHSRNHRQTLFEREEQYSGGVRSFDDDGTSDMSFRQYDRRTMGQRPEGRDFFNGGVSEPHMMSHQQGHRHQQGPGGFGGRGYESPEGYNDGFEANSFQVMSGGFEGHSRGLGDGNGNMASMPNQQQHRQQTYPNHPNSDPHVHPYHFKPNQQNPMQQHNQMHHNPNPNQNPSFNQMYMPPPYQTPMNRMSQQPSPHNYRVNQQYQDNNPNNFPQQQQQSQFNDYQHPSQQQQRRFDESYDPRVLSQMYPPENNNNSSSNHNMLPPRFTTMMRQHDTYDQSMNRVMMTNSNVAHMRNSPMEGPPPGAHPSNHFHNGMPPKPPAPAGMGHYNNGPYDHGAMRGNGRGHFDHGPGDMPGNHPDRSTDYDPYGPGMSRQNPPGRLPSTMSQMGQQQHQHPIMPNGTFVTPPMATIRVNNPLPPSNPSFSKGPSPHPSPTPPPPNHNHSSPSPPHHPYPHPPPTSHPPLSSTNAPNPPQQQQQQAPPPRLVYNVKFKRAQRSFILGPRAPRDIKIGCYVKVEADRGEDLGFVVSRMPSEKFHGSGNSGRRSVGSAGSGGSVGSAGGGVEGNVTGGNGVSMTTGTTVADLKRVIRLATQSEVSLLAVNRDEEEELLKICRTKVRQRVLPMFVVDAEYQFDRNKLTFFFEAEGRIDFRELVRDLFSIYKTRIWMQQLDKNGATTSLTTGTGAPGAALGSGGSVESDGGSIVPTIEQAGME